MPREEEVRAFYERWSRLVFSFCRLSLDGGSCGENATVRVFVSYLRSRPRLETMVVPVDLLRVAVEVTRDLRERKQPMGADRDSLAQVIPLLPDELREVFILRQILRLDIDIVAAGIGISRDRASSAFVKAVLALRDLLPPDFFKERIR